MIKKLFLYLLRKYTVTEEGRLEVYRELWYQVKSEYNEQTAFGNVYNMNIEVIISNPFIKSQVAFDNKENLETLKSGLTESFDESIEHIRKGWVR